jgi:hypothetical protein
MVQGNQTAGGVGGVLGHDPALGRAGGVGAFVVQDDLHPQPGSFCHGEADQAEEFCRQIADPPREADAGVEEKAAKARGVKGLDLAEQLGFVQIVIPEPEGDGAEFSGRIGKDRVERVGCHHAFKAQGI